VGPEKLDGFSAVLVVNIFLHISSIRMLSLQLMLPQTVRRDVLADLPFTAGDVPQPSGHQPDRRFAAGKGRPGQRCHGAAHLRRQERFSGQYPDRSGPQKLDTRLSGLAAVFIRAEEESEGLRQCLLLDGRPPILHAAMRHRA